MLIVGQNTEIKKIVGQNSWSEQTTNKKIWWKKDEQIRSGQNRDRQRVNSIKALRQ